MKDSRSLETPQHEFVRLIEFLDHPFENKGKTRKGLLRREKVTTSLSGYLERFSSNPVELSHNFPYNFNKELPYMSYIAIQYEVRDGGVVGFYVKDYIGWYRMTVYCDELSNLTEKIENMFITHRSFPCPDEVEGQWESIQLADIIDLDPGQVSETVDILNNI